jgi:hypothetical protein
MYKWIVEDIVQGSILKDTLRECSNHSQNTHHPLNPNPNSKTLNLNQNLKFKT